ncbi:photosystem II reaction center PsbP [Prochlorococcus sp. MIT 1223]|uniref:photosystem II reaction center PsbP n=1 Tax=Prochlorococcus sp. MIT 1223 TaxID=3096217 RepID=UPI002A74974D|nr:photosystem II reaction center PsbP [Prochlorococcus sp. MIT 1223]
MIQMLRSSARVLLSFVLIALIGACSANPSAGLEPFQSTDGRYGFLYPTGWTRVSVPNGPAVVFHDLINSDETLSLVISKINNDIDLENLGTPEEVGDRLIKQLISPDDQSRLIELIDSEERESSGHIFYDLEYKVTYPSSTRHELATVVIDRGTLYTFAAGTDEVRWPKVNSIFQRVVDSFTLLI